jgi:hypothetical protein
VVELLWIFLRRFMKVTGFSTQEALFNLFCKVGKLGIFWWLNRHDGVFMHFLLGIRIFSNTLSILGK